MRWTPSLVAVLLAGPTLFAAEPKDPKTLDVPAEKTASAKALIAKLDDDDILVRDKITTQLKAMGREALPALLEAQKGKLPNRVIDRVLEMLPAARRADFHARYPLFLADKDRQFDHDLAGWNELQAAVKDTKESRSLMTDILNDEECRDMLSQAIDSSVDGRGRFEGRWEVRCKGWVAEYRAGRQADGTRPKSDAPIHWAVAALLADLLYDPDYSSCFRLPVVEAYVTGTDDGKLAAAGKGKYGAVVRDFARHWIERQDRRFGLEDGEWLARVMKFDPSFVRGCMEKQFELFVKTGQGGSLGQLAYTKDAKYIPSFRRVFDVEEIICPGGGNLPAIQVRDAALSMCIALSGQDPTEYGFSAQIKTKATDDLRYWTDNYFFSGEDGKTADDKRKTAFAKWAEWEKANPDKIKAKAPDKR